MPLPTMTILFVDSPEASRRFYADLLGVEPVEASPTFAMFRPDGGPALGLWSRHTAEPRPEAAGGGAELAFPVAQAADVDSIHAEWQRRGLKILQAPTDMDFGRTFVALDPDGHRLRVFSSAP